MLLVRSRSLYYLGVATAVVVATGIAGLLATFDGQAALDARDPTVDIAVPAAPTDPAPAVRAEPARFIQQIPAELLIPPQTLTPPVARPVAASPGPPARSETTGSIPAAAVPLPHKRAGQDAKLDQPKTSHPRNESASAELAYIKATLKLTPSQERYWPPVEAALRDILTQLGYESGHLRGVKSTARAGAAAQIDPARVQRLTSAAMPLIMTFDEAQKREVRRLARIMGLEQVASAI